MNSSIECVCADGKKSFKKAIDSYSLGVYKSRKGNNPMILEKLRVLKAKILPDSVYLKMIFKKHLGYDLNLKNPKTLNEKLQWLKLNYKDPILTTCADKLAVRDYIIKKIGADYLVPLLYTTRDVNSLKTYSFPEVPFIVKANHNSGGFKIYKNKADVDIDDLISNCETWMKTVYYHKNKEWQYKNIPPTILIEQLLMDEEGGIPSDIKFTCVNGRVEIVHVDSNKEIVHMRNNYTRDFEPLEVDWPAEYPRNKYLEKIDRFDEMRTLAEKLAEPFPFVRVDFYSVQGKIYFGELTFHPTSGFGRFSPPHYDLDMGKKLDLSNVKRTWQR